MKFEVDGETYRIRFEHVHLRPPIMVEVAFDRKRMIAHATSCSIDRGDGMDDKGRWKWLRVHTAVARCSASDQYLKEKGRIVALRRAVLTWTNDRATRRAAFDAYFNRKKVA